MKCGAPIMFKFTPQFTPRLTTLLIALAGLWLSGCGTAPVKTAQPDDEARTAPPFKGGAYYKDDGPGTNPPANLAGIPDAVPKDESLHSGASRAYKALGKTYTPLTPEEAKGYKAKGMASWYGRRYHGKDTAIGEPYDMYAMTAAHATLPLPSYARVTNVENGKSVVVRLNDRGPFHEGRVIDLSYTAAYKLDILKGITEVQVEAITPGDRVAPPATPAQVAQPAPAVQTAPLPETQVAATPIPSPNLAPPEAKPVAGKVWYLQLGAFSSTAKADELVQRATEKLSKGFPGVMRLEAGGLTKVQAGPFMSDEEADKASLRIQEELGVKAYRVAAHAPAPKPAEAASASPAAAAGGAIYLQFAAVSTPAAAEAVAAKVKARFGQDLPAISQVQAGSLIKVQAGPFASAAEAETIALAYQQDFGSRPYRVTR